ncbi:MAG: hypothetical protein ABC596_06965, partial [Candidatus Methanosuratincola petrocarbonis]
MVFSAVKKALEAVGVLKKTDFDSKIDISLSALRDALKPSRSAATQDLSAQSIAANGVAEITKTDLNGWSALVVIVKASYDPSATAGVRVRWLYSPDGTNFDSPEDAE